MNTDEVDLRHHGDVEVGEGLVDLAVNVRGPAPAWLRTRLVASLDDLAAYPDPTRATRAVAGRHHRHPDEVLVTAGAAEAFVLLARALRPRHAVVVHPQFTEPEAALRAAGHPVQRLDLVWPFTFDPAAVPDSADLVVLGNPTNPTSVAHPREAVLALLRPGRTVVVDEAFADCLPGETGSVADVSAPGLIVVRSLTKTWGLAGLRVGYVLGDPAVLAALARGRVLWPVSSPALAACVATSEPAALAQAQTWAHELTARRDHLLAALSGPGLEGVQVVPGARASFVLLRHTGGDEVRTALRDQGFAARRGDTFPGLGPSWLRVAVRDEATSTAFAGALTTVLQ